MDLADREMEAVTADSQPLDEKQSQRLAAEVPHWTVGDKTMERQLKFRDFLAAMDFVNRVAEMAEAANHHPDIWISWNRVKLELSTHKIGGLSMNDFILAARIDRLVGN